MLVVLVVPSHWGAYKKEEKEKEDDWCQTQLKSAKIKSIKEMKTVTDVFISLFEISSAIHASRNQANVYRKNE